MEAGQIKQAWNKDQDAVARAFAKALQGFGYSVTADYCKAETAKLMNGEEPKGVIAMFIAGWLKDGTD